MLDESYISNKLFQGKTLVIYLPDLSGGGAERLHVHLAGEFLKAGLRVIFLLNSRSGQLLSKVPIACEIVDLSAPRMLKALPKIVEFLKTVRPDFLISNMEHTNIMCLWARAITGVPTKIISTQHISLLKQAERGSWQFKVIGTLYRLFLAWSDAVICVSSGVAEELIKISAVPVDKVAIIYNGLVNENQDNRLGKFSHDPIFATGKPVVLATGRLVHQKDHETLIRALRLVRQKVDVSLVILGEGGLRQRLSQVALECGIAQDVHLMGFVEDPLPYMRSSNLFVLSSIFEGFGNVLVEAMSCGTPVISTDCPYGPSEILEGGRYGDLVPVQDELEMSEAILRAITKSPAEPDLSHKLRDRALVFSIEKCAKNYLVLLSSLLKKPAGATQ